LLLSCNSGPLNDAPPSAATDTVTTTAVTTSNDSEMPIPRIIADTAMISPHENWSNDYQNEQELLRQKMSLQKKSKTFLSFLLMIQ
jgi:lambda repressor-like predicted transcriptional regulator